MYYTKDFVNGVLSGITNVKVTQSFGVVSNIFGKMVKHTGIDMNPIAWVIPIAFGKVITTGYDEPRGNYIILEHGDEFVSHYSHLENDTIRVQKDELVGRVKMIGRVGNTGISTGAHLHLKLTKSGVAIDPLPYLQGKLVVPPYKEVIMDRPELPTLTVKVGNLYYRDKPAGARIKYLEQKAYPYLGKSPLMSGYMWAEIIVDGKLAYCGIDPAFVDIHIPEFKPIVVELVQDGLKINLNITTQKP